MPEVLEILAWELDETTELTNVLEEPPDAVHWDVGEPKFTQEEISS